MFENVAKAQNSGVGHDKNNQNGATQRAFSIRSKRCPEMWKKMPILTWEILLTAIVIMNLSIKLKMKK